ncbi:MAG: SAM-dependent methyltransferase [Candidatus Omnitrophica bacterium]|nr:SAM-dependent methyltransferase [Candidatus Omnitrophota bacterium]
MRLDLYLVNTGLVQTRNRALHLIKTGKVFVNGKQEMKQSFSVEPVDIIKITEEHSYVSRGGYKIEKIFHNSGLTIANTEVLDLGCSTGGFSDFFLQNGASKVIGVDIAVSGPHKKILDNPRFIFRGGVDVRDANALSAAGEGRKYDFISVDLNNVCLTAFLSRAVELLKKEGVLVVLLKPPYETGSKVVSADKLKVITADFTKEIEKHFIVLKSEVSPIRGGALNRGTMEALFLLRPRES